MAMCDSMVHRGPDEEGLDLRDDVALGVRRLAVIDLQTGQQPIFNEDRTVRVIFNGEIYNYRALRRQLEDEGHRFSTAADGEVIAHLWEEHGSDFASRLNGMFAIALHDTRRRSLALVRDRLGIKPLFYASTPHHLVFGSEIKALLASGLVTKRLDLDGLGQFVAWEYVPGPGTLFKEVRKLEPGTMLLVDLAEESIRSVRWWNLPDVDAADGASQSQTLPRTEAEWQDAIDAKLRECVRRRLVSDVPLGGFLSGGVDSSLVVSGMGETRAFSIGFDDPSYNETRWAGKVARHLGISHRVEMLRPSAADLFERLMVFMDDPIGDFSIFPTYLVSKLAREEVTVALSGDGGDELFGGYDTYVAQQAARLWSCVPAPLRRGLVEPLIRSLRPHPAKKGLVNKAKHFVAGLQLDERLAHARWRLFAGEAMRRQLFTPEALLQLETPVEEHILRLNNRARSRSEIDRQLYVDLKSYLVDNCLVKVDRMSMACSLEARVPLLDHELVELAFQMPASLKIRRGHTKILLKSVAARHVPRECVYRSKEGFSMPVKEWLRNEIRPLVEELLDRRRLDRQGIFQSATVERLKREHFRGEANHSHVLWSLLVFEDWARRWGAA